MLETYVIGFDTYADAREAVDAILKEGFREEDINAIVQDKIVKGATDVDWKTIRAEKSDPPGTRGLDMIVAGKDTVITQDAGEVIAAGDIARVIVNTAASDERGPSTLADALAGSGVPDQAAAKHRDRLASGGVTLILRVHDERGRRSLSAVEPFHPRDRVKTQP